MVKYCFLTAWALTITTYFEQQCTENRHIPTDYWTCHQVTRPLTRLQLTWTLLDETLTVTTISTLTPMLTLA